MHCLSNSGTEPIVDNLAIANLHAYPLSCTAAIVGILALSVFPKKTTVQCVQCGHRTSNLTTTIWRSSKLSYTAAKIKPRRLHSDAHYSKKHLIFYSKKRLILLDKRE